MQVSTINFNTKLYTTVLKQQKDNLHKDNFKPKSNIYPSYYCPNISFGHSIIDTADFQFEYYDISNKLINENLDNFELTKDLTKNEQNDFRKNLFSSDKLTLVPFLMNTKPSILLTGDYPYFQNNDKYDFVHRILKSKTTNSIITTQNTFILNKDLTKQTIDNNKELYTKRMGLNYNTPTEDIYNELIGENCPLKEQHGYDDIIGITLGFSPINSILFQLEQTQPDTISSRRNPTYHAKLLDKAFNDENSPYKDFSDDFKNNVQKSIDYIKTRSFRKEDFVPIGYSYIQLAPDDKFNEKLINEATNNLNKAKSFIKNKKDE